MTFKLAWKNLQNPAELSCHCDLIFYLQTPVYQKTWLSKLFAIQTAPFLYDIELAEPSLNLFALSFFPLTSFARRNGCSINLLLGITTVQNQHTHIERYSATLHAQLCGRRFDGSTSHPCEDIRLYYSLIIR